MLRKFIHLSWLLCLAGVLFVLLPEDAFSSVSLSAFPDAVLRDDLKLFDSGDYEYDSDGNYILVGENDGILSDQEIKRITGISIKSNVKSIKGIEYLTALKSIKFFYLLYIKIYYNI